MAHFAKISFDNIVEEVIVINNEVVENKEFPESELIGVNFCKYLYGENTNWKQTSYNANFRKNYAGINYIYDNILDAFIPPRPYGDNWILDEETCRWIEVLGTE